MPLQMTDIADLALATRAKEKRDRLTQLAVSYRDLIGMNTLMKNHRVTLDGGDQMEFYIQKSYTHTAANSGLHDVDTVTRGDGHLITATIPWRWVKAWATWDVREPALNAPDEVRILNFAQYMETQLQLSRAIQHERNLWGKPATSSDTTTPYGIDMWITYPSTYSADGWVGANPAGFTSGVGSVSSTTYPRWKNWYARYTAVSQSDLIDKMVNAEYKTKFKSLVPGGIPDNSKGDERGIYTNWDVVKQLRTLLRDQNDDLGTDVAWGDATASFHGRPFVPVDYLDEEHDEHSTLAAYDPIYMVNWGVMEWGFMAGWDSRRTVHPAHDAHNSVVVWSDDGCNLCCYDRRLQALLSLAIS